MKITHTLYGAGEVISLDENYITIKFDTSNDTKVFKYPDAFDKHLVYEDESKQTQVLSELHNKQLIEEKQEQHQVEEAQKQKEKDLAKRLEKMKLTKKRK